MAKNENEGTSPFKLFMILPSAVRHYRDFTFIPPEVEIVGHLSNLGHQVLYIISSDRVKAPDERAENNPRILFVPIREQKASPFFILDHVRKTLTMLKRFRKEKFDVVFIRNDILPALFFDGMLALYLRRIGKAYLVFEIENPLEQNYLSRLKAGLMGERVARLISKIEALLTRNLLDRADLVIAVGEPMREYLEGINVKSNKVTMLPQGIMVSRFDHANGKAVREKYGLVDSRVVIYSGIMDMTRNLEILIEAFAILRKHMDAKLLMVGDGDARSMLQSLSSDLGIEKDVLFTGWVPQAEVPDYIASGDIGACLVPPLDFFMKSSPLKMLEYMAGGIALIANLEIPEQKKVAELSGSGLLIKYDRDSIAKGMEQLLKDGEKTRDQEMKGREWVFKERSYDRLAMMLEERIEESIGRGKRE